MDVVDPTVTNKLGVFLVLHGVDTIAQIHLNGIFLGETDNMFVRYRFNVRNLLKVNDWYSRNIKEILYFTNRLNANFRPMKVNKQKKNLAKKAITLVYSNLQLPPADLDRRIV